MVILEMLSAPVPVLERVTFCDTLVKLAPTWPNARLAGERFMVAAGATPVPVKLTVWGLPPALSVMVSAALRDPVAFGVNVRLNTQLEFAGRVLRQSVV